MKIIKNTQKWNAKIAGHVAVVFRGIDSHTVDDGQEFNIGETPQGICWTIKALENSPSGCFLILSPLLAQ